MPTVGWIALAQANIAKPDVTFYIASAPYIPKSVSSIRRDSDLSVGEAVILLDNSDGSLDYLNDYTEIQQDSCTVQLGFSGSLETFNIFTGRIEYIRFIDHDAVVEIIIRDRVTQLLNKLIGDGNDPVYYENAVDMPAGFTAWDLLTDEAGLDGTENAGNTDIDYDSWVAWSTIMEDPGGTPYTLQGYWTGETVRNALLKLCDLTESTIYVNGDGKIAFAPSYATSSSVYTQSNILTRELIIDLSEYVGQFNIRCGYNKDTGVWTSNYPNFASAFGNYNYDPELVEEDTSLWHKDIISATRMFIDSNARIGYPSRRFHIKTGMMGFCDSIGIHIYIYDALYDPINNMDAYIEEITYNIDEGTTDIIARWLWA